MAQINPWNPSQWAAAALGGVVTVDGTVVYPKNGSATGCDWFSPDSIATPHYGDGLPFRLVEITAAGQWRRTLYEGLEFNFSCAGGGHWAVTTPQGVIIDGVNHGFTIAPLCYGPDGTLAYYPWNGQGLWLLRPNGEVVHLSDALCQDVRVYGWVIASWREGSNIKQVGLANFPSNPQTVHSAFGWLNIYVDDGVYWSAYQVFDHPALSIVMHQTHDASRGKVLATSGDAFRLAASSEIAVYSVVDRDLPSDLRVVYVPDVPMTSFAVVPPPPPPPDDDDDPGEPMPDIPSLFEHVKAVYEKYGGQNRGAMVNEIAWRGNGNKADGPWMLSRKEGGANAEQPRTKEKVAHDVVQYGPTDAQTGAFKGFDVFTYSAPVWIEAHQHNDTNRIGIPPVAPEGVTPPDDDDDNTDLPGQGGVERAILALVVAAFEPMAEVVERLDTKYRELEAKVADLQQNGGGTGTFPTKVALLTDHGKYISAQSDGSLVADRESAGGWEVFTVEPK